MWSLHLLPKGWSFAFGNWWHKFVIWGQKTHLISTPWALLNPKRCITSDFMKTLYLLDTRNLYIISMLHDPTTELKMATTTIQSLDYVQIYFLQGTHQGTAIHETKQLTLGKRKQPGAPLRVNVVAFHLCHGNSHGISVSHGWWSQEGKDTFSFPRSILPCFPHWTLLPKIFTKDQLTFYFRFTH